VIAELRGEVSRLTEDAKCAWANNGILERARQAADAEVERLKAELPYDWDKYKASQDSLREHMLLVGAEKQAREAAEARLAELRNDVVSAPHSDLRCDSHMCGSECWKIAALDKSAES
jgi:hypothetical protein